MHQILTRGANLDQYTTENSPQTNALFSPVWVKFYNNHSDKLL